MTSKNKKKVDFSVRPRAAKQELPPTVDEWVAGTSNDKLKEGKGTDSEPQKEQRLTRLTLNLPAEFHMAFKARCVMQGVTIQDKVHKLIEQDLADSRRSAEDKPSTA